MILARIKQLCYYFFFSFTKEMEEEVKQILEEKEFNIFLTMAEYDKVHSYYLLKKIQTSSLQENILYQKLALLHDSGKNKKTLLARAYTVFFDQEHRQDQHPEIAYQKLLAINEELAKLCLLHHKKAETKEMKLFQELDDR